MDRSINPSQVKDIKSAAKDEVQNSMVELIDGTVVYVQGSVIEITRRLNTSNQKILKG